jgi:hypothetical protein
MDEAYAYIADLEYDKEELVSVAIDWEAYSKELERMGVAGLRHLERLDPLGFALGKYSLATEGVEAPPSAFLVCPSTYSHLSCSGQQTGK